MCVDLTVGTVKRNVGPCHETNDRFSECDLKLLKEYIFPLKDMYTLSKLRFLAKLVSKLGKEVVLKVLTFDSVEKFSSHFFVEFHMNKNIFYTDHDSYIPYEPNLMIFFCEK